MAKLQQGRTSGVVAPDRRWMREAADILVAGAGPTGLALALQAHDHSAAVRVIDRRPEEVRPSLADPARPHARGVAPLRVTRFHVLERPALVGPQVFAQCTQAPHRAAPGEQIGRHDEEALRGQPVSLAA